MARIRDDKRFDMNHATFLEKAGLVTELEGYVIGRNRTIDGNLYTWLLPLAELLHERERYLAATLVYRPLLESILARGHTKAYYYGARYLLTLDKLAEKIDDWCGILPHTAYRSRIEEQHRRKSRFWREVAGLDGPTSGGI